MYEIDCTPLDVGVSRFVTPLQWSIIAFLGFVYPNAFATSFATNQGSPLILVW